jgi:hypothetical protein
MTTTLEVTSAAVAARGTYIDAVSVDELFVDDSYQRTLGAARCLQLAAGWDRRLGGVDRGQRPPRGPVSALRHR